MERPPVLESLWQRVWARETAVDMPDFPYQQPAWQNWREALFPHTIGLAAVEPAAKSSKAD